MAKYGSSYSNTVAVVNGREANAKETGSENVEIGNGGKSALLKFRDTAILHVFMKLLCLFCRILLKLVLRTIYASFAAVAIDFDSLIFPS